MYPPRDTGLTGLVSRLASLNTLALMAPAALQHSLYLKPVQQGLLYLGGLLGGTFKENLHKVSLNLGVPGMFYCRVVYACSGSPAY